MGESKIIQFPNPREDKLDIVIPVYGAIPHLMKCLRGLGEWPTIVVDDCGPGEKELSVLLRKYDIQYHRNEKNEGFIYSCHQGASMSDKPYILFLNSDVIPTIFSIMSMLYQLTLGDNVAIVGCCLLLPDIPRIQHAGVARNPDGIPYHPFMHLHPLTPHARRTMDVNAVTGAAFMIRRDIWDMFGGFDTRYGKGVFEDVDLCWRVRQNGWRVVYEGTVDMYHTMHGSRIQGQPYIHDQGAENLKVLLKRFGNLGSDEYLFYGDLG